MWSDRVGSMMPHAADGASTCQNLMAPMVPKRLHTRIAQAAQQAGAARPQCTDDEQNGSCQLTEVCAHGSPRPGEGGALRIVKAAQQAAALLRIADQRPVERLLVRQPGALEPLCRSHNILSHQGILAGSVP